MPVTYFDGRPVLIGFSTDITELHQLKEELKRLANTDELTRLANRRNFTKPPNATLPIADVTTPR